MRTLGIASLLALCALPARGEEAPDDRTVLHALTVMDSPLTKAELEGALGGTAFTTVRDYATHGEDVGAQLRAIRALPQFCDDVDRCAEARAVLIDVLDDPPATEGVALLRLRAGIEALGAMHSGDPADVEAVRVHIDHPSRDIRATTARAIRDICNGSEETKNILRARLQGEQVPQVQLALSRAITDLQNCTP